jgi:hypothetical protein
MSFQLHVPAALSRGNRPRYPLDRKLGGSQTQSGRCGEKENIVPARNRIPAIHPVARRYTVSHLKEEYKFENIGAYGLFGEEAEGVNGSRRSVMKSFVINTHYNMLLGLTNQSDILYTNVIHLSAFLLLTVYELSFHVLLSGSSMEISC